MSVTQQMKLDDESGETRAKISRWGGRRMNQRVWLIVFAASFGLMLAGAIIGNILESKGVLTKEALGTNGVYAIKLFFFTLFCIAALSLVPLAVRYFIAMQIKIGNGEFSLIKWLQAHESTVVFCFWGLCVVGLFLALPAARKAGFFK